jgi:hypothetical protein
MAQRKTIIEEDVAAATKWAVEIGLENPVDGRTPVEWHALAMHDANTKLITALVLMVQMAHAMLNTKTVQFSAEQREFMGVREDRAVKALDFCGVHIMDGKVI